MVRHLIAVIFLLNLSLVQAQNYAVNLSDLKGGSIQFDSLLTSETPVVISFWATWCKPCIQELNAVSEVLDDWKEETDVSFFAISTDDARTVSRVIPVAKARDWGVDVYSDQNGDLQRKLGVNNVPHTFLFYRGELVWQHTAYAPGDEEELYEQITSLVE